VANQSKATSMAELMARSQQLSTLQKGQIIEGTVKKLTPQEILLDIGAKSDALVIEYDRQNLDNLLALLKVGDIVSASVISPESEEGFPVVSLRKMLDDRLFSQFESEFKDNKTLSVNLTDSTRGGYFVESSRGLKGFLPNSQILPEVREKEGNLVGTAVDVKIIEFDKPRKRIILSQKATVFVSDSAELSKLAPKGSTVKGKVTAVTPYGLYVIVEPHKDAKVEAFVHISELSHDRVEDINALYKVGDTLEGQVKEIDGENRRLNLSVKNLAADTFDTVKEQFPLESKITGEITDVKSRGVTIKLKDGIVGFIPVSKIPAGTTYEVGNTVDAEITDYDVKRRHVIVSPVLKAKFVGYR
jgi:ribosomal protein S1